MPTPSITAGLAAAAERPRQPDGVDPTAAEVFLRQALGGNVADVRLPVILFTVALLIAMVGMLLRRRRGRVDENEES
jgi:hypothetical protein